MKYASLTYKSSSVSNGWPMLSYRERCPTNWYQDQRSYVWYLKKLYTRYKWYKLQVVSFQQSSDVHKNARFKPQPSTPNAYLCINKKHTFYGNWWQRGRDCIKIWKLDWMGEKLDMDKEGATLKKRDGSKFLDKKSTQPRSAYPIFGLFGFFFSQKVFSLTIIQPEQCFSANFSQNSASRTGP